MNVSGSQDLVSMDELDNAGQVNITLGEVYVGDGTPVLAGQGVAEFYQDSSGVLDEIFTSTSSFGTIDVSGEVYQSRSFAASRRAKS
jgi:hypothetical protein